MVACRDRPSARGAGSGARTAVAPIADAAVRDAVLPDADSRIATGAPSAAAAPPNPDGIDGWYGPDTGNLTLARSPHATSLTIQDEGAWEAPGTPFSSVTTVTWDDSDYNTADPALDDADAGDAWSIAVATPRGWYVAPRLGTHANRARCSITRVERFDTRLAIAYECELGRFDEAGKHFFLLCASDAAERIACARYETVAYTISESAPKEDHSKSSISYERSCKAVVKGSSVVFTYAAPGRDHDFVEIKTRTCPPKSTPSLVGPFSPGRGGPPPTFDRSGLPRIPPAYRPRTK
ncbi:MAG: hypothetical protein KBG15_05325 [Kofleriaceae bacterium]|nr:hypothetical protein [Kofleriaceae bacterium]